MKLNINFLQSGGVPLTNDLMDSIMEAIRLYDVLGSIAGNLTILAGCDPVGSSVTVVNPGIVAINGEVLFFEGGPISPNVFIYEQEVSKVFQDQQSKILIKKRTVKFGNATPPNSYAWSEFLKLKTLKEIEISLDGKASQAQVDNHEIRIKKLEMKTAPIENGGVVFIFQRPTNEIPAGWKECTDLRGKTVFGYFPGDPDFGVLGASGGSISQTLEKQHLPAIKIKTSVLQPYGANNNNGGFKGGDSQWNYQNRESEPLGNSKPFSLLNPHKIVTFIEPNFQ